MFTTGTELSFSGDLAASSFEVMQVNDQFINELRTKGEIVIDGTQDDRVQFFTETETFKITKINIPTTILITQPTGNIVKESTGYLSVQKCRPSLKIVHEGLKLYSVSELDYKMCSLQQILQEKTLSENLICSKFKISPAELREYMVMAYHVKYEDGWLIISDRLFNSVFNYLLTFLTDKNAFQSKFAVSDVLPQLQLKVHPEVLEATLRKFGCQAQPGLYQITVSSITKFVLSEIALVKKEYIREEFDSIFGKLMGIYVPEGLQRPKESPQISMYFLEIKDHGGIYFHYNIIEMPTTANEMVQYLSKIKSRYSYNEAINLFRFVYKGKNIDQALVKHFRKYAKDYELKGVFTM